MKSMLVDLDMRNHQLKNTVFDARSNPPLNPVEGQLYYDISTKIVKKFDGEHWTPVGQSYTLLPATENTLGGIKVGNNLSIDENGVLSATANMENVIVLRGTKPTYADIIAISNPQIVETLYCESEYNEYT